MSRIQDSVLYSGKRKKQKLTASKVQYKSEKLSEHAK